MLGAIAGDVIGSAYESNRVSSRDFSLFSPASRFTDDSVPEAIIAFLESTDFESAVRNATFLGGDADTQACIAGGICGGVLRREYPRISRMSACGGIRGRLIL
jgi:ADP-ribosylglycohydrolase